MVNLDVTAILAALLALATPALSADHETWATSGDWKIMVDPATGNGCYMQKTFDDGTVVQFGAVPDRDGGFVAAYNAAWDFVDEADTGTVRFEFPDVIFEGEVVGELRAGVPGGRAFFDNPNLPLEFAKRKSMTIVGQRVGRVEIDLSGTSAAIRAVRDCQDQQAIDASE